MGAPPAETTRPALDAGVIRKSRGAWRVAPNLIDYDAARATFSWERAMREELSGLPDGAGLNIAYEAVDRHAARLQGRDIAIDGTHRHFERIRQRRSGHGTARRAQDLDDVEQPVCPTHDKASRSDPQRLLTERCQ